MSLRPHIPVWTPPERAARRAARMRRIRQFFIASVLLHVIVLASLAVSPRLRAMVFGDGSPAPQMDAREAEIQRAMDTLLELQHRRLTRTLTQLAGYRDQLNEIRERNLARLFEADEERRRSIAAGTWPTAERPDRDAVFSPLMDVEPPVIERSALPNFEEKDILELYRMHQPMEEEAGRLYERFRAMQLVEHPEEPIPFSAAIDSTRLVMPVRRDIEPEKLNREIDTVLDGRFKAFRDELNETYLEAENMVVNARRWVELAMELETRRSDQFGELYDVIPPPTAYYGHYLNPNQLRRVSLQRVINPPVSLGNALGEEGTHPSEWMSIDRWYYVGPFTHPGRQRRLDQLDRHYPPESGVDLDATYEGKDGRRLTWKYRRMDPEFLENGIRIEPFVIDNESYAIWYFYTEVHSDADRTVLASFASDDFGVCWVNGRRVWQGPPEQQPWVPFAAHNFRVVPLKKGINQFLFKLENAPGTTGFSVILMTYEDPVLTEGIPSEASR
ncbi:MAG: hypothetical protein JJU29_06295 [Verrucomicrobia bacterium]|nr:hypothetical protein [Verrucomicrobiota bacterium]